MKIAIVSPGFAPVIGGVESVVEGMAVELAHRGVTTEVWAFDRGVSQPTTESYADVVVRRFPTTKSTRFGFSRTLLRHARRYGAEIDLVHVHSYHASAALAALLVPRNVPVAFSPHYHGGGHSLMANILHIPYRFLGRRIFARSNVLVAVSAAEAALIDQDFPGITAPVAIVHNAVDLDDIHKAEPFPGEPATLLTLGRLERYKNIDSVIAAFDAITTPSQLVIVGDGSDRERLEGLAKASKRRKDIRFLGFIDRNEVNRWLRTAAAVVSMSEHEAFGIAAAEGVAGGTTAVLSDLPAHREVAELLPKSSVSLISAQDDLTTALERALSVPNDGPRNVRDWSVVVDELLDCYARVPGFSGATQP